MEYLIIRPKRSDFAQTRPIWKKHPYGFARMLGALDLYLAGPLEIGLRGEKDDPTIQRCCAKFFNPISRTDPRPDCLRLRPEWKSISFWKSPDHRRQANGICLPELSCKLPVTTPADLAAQLKAE